MKIGFDAKRLFNNFTGLGNYSRFVVKALADHYPDNEYRLYSPKIKSSSDTEFFFHQNTISLKKPHGLQAKWGGVWRSYCLGNVATRDQVQVFHGLSNELPVTKPNGLKTIVTIHDVIYKRYPAFYKPVDRAIYDFKFKKACESADQIIAVSEQTARDVIEFLKADAKKVKVIYQGCHPVFHVKYSQEQIQSVKQKYHLPDQFILNVGTIESRKNALLILKALALMQEKVTLVVAGRATSYQQELDQFIQANKLNDQVQFIHNASFTDLPLIYQSARAFVYPSFFEGFGIPIVEAIASGLPVVSSKGSCFAEAGGADCLYIDPHSPEDLASAILDVWRNEANVKQRVLRSQQYIQRFEPKVIASELMNIYRSLV